MDDSDDPVDAEIYASLRKRLEELEKSAPALDTGNGSGLQPATPTTWVPLVRSPVTMSADSHGMAEEGERSMGRV